MLFQTGCSSVGNYRLTPSSCLASFEGGNPTSPPRATALGASGSRPPMRRWPRFLASRLKAFVGSTYPNLSLPDSLRKKPNRALTGGNGYPREPVCSGLSGIILSKINNYV